MITAEDFLNTSLGGNMNIISLKPIVFKEIMIDFAKLHCKEQSKDIAKKFRNSNDKDLIVKAYPIENIK